MNGIDVSNNNHSVNWTGVDFCFRKATEGVSFVDSTQAGYAFKVPLDGPYHFAHPDQNSPDAEAAYFLKHAIPGQFWSLDCETRGSTSPLAIMGADRLAGWCDRFYELVAPVLGPNGYHYTFRSYASALWPKLTKSWRWWLASAAGAPAYPTYAGKTVDIEQFAIVGGVDRNLAYTPILLPPSNGEDMPLSPADALVVTAAVENAIRVMAGVPLDTTPEELANVQNLHQMANTENAIRVMFGVPPDATPDQLVDALAAKVAAKIPAAGGGKLSGNATVNVDLQPG